MPLYRAFPPAKYRLGVLHAGEKLLNRFYTGGRFARAASPNDRRLRHRNTVCSAGNTADRFAREKSSEAYLVFPLSVAGSLEDATDGEGGLVEGLVPEYSRVESWTDEIGG